MKFILELDARETRELIKDGILESITKKLDGSFNKEKKEEIKEVEEKETAKEVTEVVENAEENTEKVEEKDEKTSTMSATEFKSRLVALTKEGKKDLVKKVLLDKGYGRVSAVKEEDFADILKELA